MKNIKWQITGITGSWKYIMLLPWTSMRENKVISFPFRSSKCYNLKICSAGSVATRFFHQKVTERSITGINLCDKCHRLLLLQAWLLNRQNSTAVKYVWTCGCEWVCVCVFHPSGTGCCTNPIKSWHQQNTASAAWWNGPLRNSTDQSRDQFTSSLMGSKGGRDTSRPRTISVPFQGQCCIII